MTINEWLEISEMSGKGNAKVTLTAPSYEEGETRVLRLAVKGRYGTKYVNIRQDSKAETIVNQYLWVLFEEEGEISGIKSSTIQYSYDRESWTSFPANGSITVPANTYVWFKNTSNILNHNLTSSLTSKFDFSKRGSVGGDLSSMGDMMIGNFSNLFYYNTNLTDASKLILPWNVLEESCYDSMFQYCDYLTTSPELPAITLANSCYKDMFYGCGSLVNAPTLPAPTLADSCYWGMFDNCTSLVNAPELPATTLAESCYQYMFEKCTSLTTAPQLPATTLADSCYDSMFRGCSSLTTAPTLPAPTLADSCYWGMFIDCSNLNYIKMLATDISGFLSLGSWVKGVAPTGTFVKHPDMNDLTIGESGIPEGWVVMNEGNGEGGDEDDDDEDVNNEYFWVKLEEDGDIQGLRTTFEYSTDQINWQSCPTTLSVPANTYVWFRNTSSILNATNATTIRFTKRGSVGGDLSSIGDMRENNFKQLFYENDELVDASKLILPWDVLAYYCYNRMFYGCSSLTTAPTLPATTLADYCYVSMFNGCTSLVVAPELPAITLAESCYQYMFENCTSLVNAPELPATTLAKNCCYFMFCDCTSLVNAPELPATILATNCYLCMFNGCTSLVNAPTILPATDLRECCYQQMFYGCTNLLNAPELPSTTLSASCYTYMFYGCTNLVNVPSILPATTLADFCYDSMFYGCTSLVVAPELPSTTLSGYCYANMFTNCSNLNYIKMLATDIESYYDLSDWVFGVAENGTFVKHPDMNDLPSGSSGIPNGWTVINATE